MKLAEGKQSTINDCDRESGAALNIVPNRELTEGFISRHQHFCRLCHSTIKTGERIYGIRPEHAATEECSLDHELDKADLHAKQMIQSDKMVTDKDWVHYNCAEAKNVLQDRSMRPICKHWMKRGRCLFQDRCFFAHPEHKKGKEPKQRTWGGKRRFVRNGGRANIFRRFIVEEFADIIGPSHPVIDVAAGKGQLSFLLSNLNGITCVALEPRKLSVERYCRRLKLGLFHRTGLVEQRMITRACSDSLLPIQHARLCLTQKVVDLIAGDSETCSGELVEEVGSCLEEARNLQWTRKGLLSNHGDTEHDAGNQHCSETEPEPEPEAPNGRDQLEDSAEDCVAEIYDPGKTITLIKSSLLVVGMHPDQATELIVDLALELGVSFAVVPCCVYHTSFPHRRLKNGMAVRSYEQFIQYLADKKKGTKVVTLNFEGRNKCVYFKATRQA